MNTLFSNIYLVSQFTLQASTRKGNKPDFHGAAGGDKARELYDCFFAKVQDLYNPEKVKNGVFQAMMEGEYLFRICTWTLIQSETCFSEPSEFRSCECGVC